MSMTFRPSTHAERDQVVAALQAWMATPGADSTLVALTTTLCLPALEAYVAARQAWPEKFAEARVASAAADAADEAFDRDLRLLSASIRDAAGRSQPRVLADMMGGTLASELTRLPYRKEITKGSALVTTLKARADLGVDPALLSGLEASVDALRLAANEDELASRASALAGATQRATAAAFDLAYGRLVRAFKAYAGESSAAAILPRFVRVEDDEDAGDVGAALTTLPLEPAPTEGSPDGAPA